jgi:hypothetical protein
MATRTSDRAHMRDDLRQLALLASGPKAVPSSAHAIESPDSSGYVDLSAFSATDDGWVDRELERAKGRVVLTPGSLRPISMEALLEAEPAESKPSRARTWVYSGLGLLGAGLIAFLAVTLSKHAPPAPAKAVVDAPAVVTPSPATAAPATPAAPGATVAGPASIAGASPVASVVIAAPDLTPTSKKHAGARRATPASAPAHVAMARPAAAPRVVIPAAKGAGGGDSLMDAIRASVVKK